MHRPALFGRRHAATSLACVAALATSLVVLVAPGERTVLAAGGDGFVVDDTVTAVVRDGSPSTSEDACSWHIATGVDPVTGRLTEQPITRERKGFTETLYQRTCREKSYEHWYAWIRRSTTGTLATRAEARATERITRLVFRTAPPADRTVVGIGTWFWVPRMVWKPVSATATVTTPAGPVSVTVTATPSRLRYDPGNGDDAVWCDGPGEPWTRRAGDSATSECMYTYRHASSTLRARRAGSRNGRYPARTAVEWKLRVTSNIGLGFPLPSVRLGLDTPVTVHELQALLGD